MRRLVPFDPVMGIPRTACNTASFYRIAMATTMVLLVMGYPPNTAVEVPLAVLASVRGLLAMDGSQMLSMLRRVVGTGGIGGPGELLNTGAVG